MTLNRRAFMKVCGVSGAVIALPGLAMGNVPDNESMFLGSFDPSKVYGNAIQVTGRLSEMGKEHKRAIYKVVMDNMSRSVPREYRGRVTYREDENYGYSEDSIIMWKYNPRKK